jgi:hypothetical protein
MKMATGQELLNISTITMYQFDVMCREYYYKKLQGEKAHKQLAEMYVEEYYKWSERAQLQGYKIPLKERIDLENEVIADFTDMDMDDVHSVYTWRMEFTGQLLNHNNTLGYYVLSV